MPKISLDMPAEIISDLKLHVGDDKKYVSLADAINSLSTIIRPIR